MKIFNKISKYILKKLSRVVFHLIPEELYVFFKIREEDTYTLFKRKQILESFNHFEKHLASSIHFSDVSDIRKYAIEKSLSYDKERKKCYMDFGVHKGTSSNFFSGYVNKLHAFDSFKGLREDWAGTGAQKGHLRLEKIPKLNKNIDLIVGYIQDTLDDFLKSHNPKINFIHMDLDTYESTKYALEKLKPYLAKNSIILFDELYNYPGWKNGEYKALEQTFNENEYKFKAFSVNANRVVIQIN